MEPKKTPKADLESKRSTFVYLGLAIALGIVLGAFSMTTRVKAADSMGSTEVEMEEETLIPITDVKPPPPPPPPPPPQVIETLTIVEDDVELDDELEMDETEIEADEEIIAEIPEVVEEVVEKIQTPFVSVEEMPEFPGGIKNLMKFLGKNVKYPTIALENGVQGKVYVQFVVEKDGAVSGARVLRAVNPALDKEALRVVNALPKWKPGRQGGETVRCYFQVPVNFKIQ